MESAKPIEAGCMAWVIDAHLDSTLQPWSVVEIIRKVEFGEILSNGQFVDAIDCWMFEQDGDVGVGSEKYFLRIDDDELQKQIESEKELENV